MIPVRQIFLADKIQSFYDGFFFFFIQGRGQKGRGKPRNHLALQLQAALNLFLFFVGKAFPPGGIVIIISHLALGRRGGRSAAARPPSPSIPARRA